jgi:hypothetical protein
MYYQKIAFIICAAAAISTVLGASFRGMRDYPVEARENFHRTFSNDRSLDVDNINGTIEIIGDGGNTIRVDGEKIVRAIDQRELERARREVTLDINEKDGVAQLYVNGPFRNGRSQSEDHGFHFHDDGEYEVTYNFTIHAPRETELRLRDVNGDINAQETSGKFDIRDVNGGVTMTGTAGSGSARTVNGRTAVTFRETPKAPCDFQSVNGEIDAAFPPGLSADLRVKTFNGGAYTDFESTLLGTPATTAAERRNGRFVYKSNRFTSLRVGSGGPDLRFETLNGDIRIRKEAH